MQLPANLQIKINELYLSLNKKDLVTTQQNLTSKYKTSSGQSKSLIGSKQDSILYAISRMPATYAVTFTLVSDLIKQGALLDVRSVTDVGSGTGAGYFALKEIDETLDIKLVEKDKFMIETFLKLANENVSVDKLDLIKDKLSFNSDLIMSSFVLSEMTEEDRIKTFKKLLNETKKYLLLIDTGTPKTYEQMMRLKSVAYEQGYKVIAPCAGEKCLLKNDYCQFYARVERSALHKLAKGGKLSYEDEKYFYLLFAKSNTQNSGKRVIRRPIINPNEVKLKFCTNDGVEETLFTKKDKENFKRARKAKINELF